MIEMMEVEADDLIAKIRLAFDQFIEPCEELDTRADQQDSS